MKQWKALKILKTRKPLQGCQGRVGRPLLMVYIVPISASGVCQQSTRPQSKLSCWNAPTVWNISAPPGSGSIRDTEKYTLWFCLMAIMPAGRFWGRDVLGCLWMALPLTWIFLYTWIFATITAKEHFARSVVVVAFALTTAHGTFARSVVVVAFALTITGDTDVQCARLNPDLPCKEKRSSSKPQLFRSGHREFLNIFDWLDVENWPMKSHEAICSMSVSVGVVQPKFGHFKAPPRFPHKWSMSRWNWTSTPTFTGSTGIY